MNAVTSETIDRHAGGISTVSYRRGRLTADEKTRIEDWAAIGWTSGRIAQRLDRNPSTIHFHMVTNGLKVTSRRRRGSYTRNGVTVAGFTALEDTLITTLRLQAFSTVRIARVVTKRFGHKRTACTIHTRLRMLATLDQADDA
jgi:DNA-binding CsgD family transcriptional regulator